MKTIYLMTRLAWKVFISSKPCRLIVILLQGFVQHMFDKLLFLLTPLKIAISYKVKKNSTKWNSRAERGCRMATSSMRASVHPARRAFCIIGKFGELSYDIKYHTKNVPESFGDESLYLGDEWFLQSHSTPVVLKFPL